jgi:hypothetical protein
MAPSANSPARDVSAPSDTEAAEPKAYVHAALLRTGEAPVIEERACSPMQPYSARKAATCSTNASGCSISGWCPAPSISAKREPGINRL